MNEIEIAIIGIATGTAIDANNRFIKMLGADIVDSILISGSGSPEYQLPEELKNRAFEAGARLF